MSCDVCTRSAVYLYSMKQSLSEIISTFTVAVPFQKQKLTARGLRYFI